MDTSGGSGTILVVEDDQDVAGLLARVLERDGYTVRPARTGAEAVLAVTGAREPTALVLLDVNLPDLDGFEVLSRIRRQGTTPVILVSGRCGLDDRVQGLDLGADDYVVKPFAARELVARVRSVLRRGGSGSPPRGPEHVPGPAPLVIDAAARIVSAGAAVVHLTPREFDLLAFLAASPGRAFSRQELLEQVWGSSPQWQDPATVTEHVRRLRGKIGALPAPPCSIATVRGAGYRFDGTRGRAALNR